eukprot:m.111705 g.111705  ORF g.111705 m.111705 type:complete len:137 (+) comp12945_c0_seq2:4369-4779(+)
MHTPATRVQGLKAQCAKTHEDTAHLTDQLRHQGILIETLSETIGAKRTELSQLRDELDTMTTKTGNFEKTISSLQRELHRLRTKLRKQSQKTWGSAFLKWLRSVLGSQKYEVKTSGVPASFPAAECTSQTGAQNCT